jgi:hypothetical protein
MRRSTIVFALFIVIIAGIMGYNAFLRQQPPLEITLAVDPSAEDWATRLVAAFNERNVQVGASATRVRFVVDATKTDVNVWQGRVQWTNDNHPEAWIATSSWIVDFAPTNLTFVVVEPSLATSPFVWGGFESRVNLVTDDGANLLGWDTAHAAADAESWQALGAPDNSWGFVNIGVNRSGSSVAGINALASMLASYSNNATLSSSIFGDSAFRTWFAPLKQAMQSSQQLGESPASAMASRGAIVAGFALVPEYEWLSHLQNLVRQERVQFTYADYGTLLNFPLVMWEDGRTTAEERQAILAFADFVKSADGQQITLLAGLRPVGVVPTESDPLFANAQQYGITLELTDVPLVNFDPSVAEQLLRLME